MKLMVSLILIKIRHQEQVKKDQLTRKVVYLWKCTDEVLLLDGTALTKCLWVKYILKSNCCMDSRYVLCASWWCH